MTIFHLSERMEIKGKESRLIDSIHSLVGGWWLVQSAKIAIFGWSAFDVAFYVKYSTYILFTYRTNTYISR